MPIIDDRGFILGKINIIDVLVILLVLSLFVAGYAFITATDDQAERTVVLDAGVQSEFVVDTIEVGAVQSSDVVSIDDIATNETDDGTELILTLTLAVDEDADGLAHYHDERLHVDRDIEVDLDVAIVEGTVIEISQ